MPLDTSARHDPGSPRLEARLRRELKGEVRFDRFTRGRYSTDASIYQIEPIGVLVPKRASDIEAAIATAPGLLRLWPSQSNIMRVDSIIA